jgi:hypothetical protein
MASSSQVKKGRNAMSPVRVSGALLETLGGPASTELNQILDAHQRASTEAVMTQCADRFELRLVEETSTLRVDIAEMRGEMREGFAALRGAIATNRFELLRWSFGFWVAQAIALAGVLSWLLRAMPGR